MSRSRRPSHLRHGTPRTALMSRHGLLKLLSLVAVSGHAENAQLQQDELKHRILPDRRSSGTTFSRELQAQSELRLSPGS